MLPRKNSNETGETKRYMVVSPHGNVVGTGYTKACAWMSFIPSGAILNCPFQSSEEPGWPWNSIGYELREEIVKETQDAQAAS